MTDRLLALIIAAVSGMAMAAQGTLNSVMGKAVGLLEATFVVHVVGLLFVIVLLFTLGSGLGKMSLLLSQPWYLYLGGVLGVVIIYLVVRSIPKVGVAPATTAIILGQVLTAGIIDHMGFCGMERIPFTWYRVAGTLLMAAGAWLILKK